MTATLSSFTSPSDATALATYAWDDVADPVGVVQVAHGLAEHGARYDRLARALNAAGYVVHATDHRGHGGSIAGTPGDFGAAGFEGLIADVAAFGASLRQVAPVTCRCSSSPTRWARSRRSRCSSTTPTSTTAWCSPGRPPST